MYTETIDKFSRVSDQFRAGRPYVGLGIILIFSLGAAE